MDDDPTFTNPRSLGQQLIDAVKENKIDEAVRLLDEGADINTVSDDLWQESSISIATERGHFGILETLYNRGASLQVKDKNGWSPVWWAAVNGRREILSFFFSKEETISQDHFNGRNILFVAAGYGTPQDVGRFLSTALNAGAEINPDPRDNDGMTPLMLAARNGRDDNVEVLLKAGADPLLVDKKGRSAMYHASKRGKFATIRLLFDRCNSSSTNTDFSRGFPTTGKGHVLLSLTVAVAGNDDQWEDFVKNTKPDFELADVQGRTALSFAAMYGSVVGVQRLADVGSVDAHDLSGYTPLVLASRRGQAEVVELLLTKGANAALSDSEYGQAPLMWAAENGHDKVVEILLPKSDVGARAKNGFTALHFASYQGHATCAEMLIEAGAALEATDRDYGQSCLSWAAENGHLETVKVLIKAGAKMYSVEPCGKVPIWFALRRGHELIKAFIEEPRREGKAGDEPTPRVRAAELALRCSYDWGDVGVTHDDDGSGEPTIRDFILNQTQYLTAIDNNGRNLISWAAEAGNSQEMRKLCSLGVLGFNLPDTTGRTPLSWAAGSRNEATFKLLSARSDVDLSSRDERGQTILHWAADGGNPNIVGHVLAATKVDLESPDKDNQTPIFKAAAKGHRRALNLLLQGGAWVDSKDQAGRSVLSWAAKNGNIDCIQSLIDSGAALDTPDSFRRTPLSYAAEGGHAEVVECLVRLQDGRPRRGDGVEKQGKKGVEVNSRDTKSWTPLWYAAMNGHLAAFNILIAAGANSSITDDHGRTLQEALEERRAELGAQTSASSHDILEKLKLSGLLWSKAPDDSREADRDFYATLMGVPERNNNTEDISLHAVRLESLLRGERPPMSRGTSCEWLHLPANNMRWVEVLIAKHYDACGSKEAWKANVVLKNRLWEKQQHIPREGSYHARFMRPACHSLGLRETSSNTTRTSDTQSAKPRSPERKQDSDLPKNGAMSQDGGLKRPKDVDSTRIKQKEDKQRSSSRPGNQTPTFHDRYSSQGVRGGMALFMPYLHWELEEEQNKLKAIMRQKKGLLVNADGKAEHQKLLSMALARTDLCGTEKLYWRYLDEGHPLHPRRTLDQFYYHTLLDTDNRDEDQTCIRYFMNRETDFTSRNPKMKRVLTMVDQLWMWVLPACGNKPPTVVTAFPQRSNRMGSNTSKSMTGLVSNIIDRFRESVEWSVEELAEVIATECSRIYFDTMSNRNEPIQFLEIYTTSIGEITENETKRFQELQWFMENLRVIEYKPADSPPDAEEPEIFLKRLLNIKGEIEDLRKIKDIRDELNILLTVSHTQKGVLQTMEHMLHPQHQKNHGRAGPLRRGMTTTFVEDDGVDHRNNSTTDHAMLHSLMLMVVERNIDEVVRLDRFAERAAQAIGHLLNLKHKQDNLLEEKLTRDLTRGIYKINDGTDRQGKTIMYFTVVTIIFLPLSFMASFLTIEVEEFPRSEDGHLRLDFVLKVILSVSVALIIPFVLVAFNLDPKRRTKNLAALPKLKTPSFPKPKWSWRDWKERSKESDLETAAGDPEPRMTDGDSAGDESMGTHINGK
ncbi:ankyrin repeat-containing domain protein [Cercophora newfieldiana]|uniref:Ankyrin repeat-containing domain protein n=1 Tax=Cercophora newfieldiana TaxID=92897 RepID=A0AA39YTF0_9PEZI|nr:ankyrin repeat-containing domain protein [Cercophora newfieldiana]